MTDRYRKKPVEIRAWKIGFDGQEPDWVREAFAEGRIDWCPAGEGLYINTLEGRMKTGIGNMLIEGVKGELYGCRADIFAATYEPVETTLATLSAALAEPTCKQSLQVEVMCDVPGACRAPGQKTTQWCAEAERVRGELCEQIKRDEALLRQALDALRADADTLKDAERYRYIRRKESSGGGSADLCIFRVRWAKSGVKSPEPDYDLLVECEADAAIDEAMEKELNSGIERYVK